MLFDVQRREREGWTVLTITGELDLSAVPRVRQAAMHVVPPPGGPAGGRRVVVDLSETDFLDSAGLGVVLGIVRRTRQSGGRAAVVVGPSGRGSGEIRESPAARIFSVLGLERAVPVATDLEEVLARDREGTLEPADAMAGPAGGGRDG